MDKCLISKANVKTCFQYQHSIPYERYETIMIVVIYFYENHSQSEIFLQLKTILVFSVKNFCF